MARRTWQGWHQLLFSDHPQKCNKFCGNGKQESPPVGNPQGRVLKTNQAREAMHHASRCGQGVGTIIFFPGPTHVSASSPDLTAVQDGSDEPPHVCLLLARKAQVRQRLIHRTELRPVVHVVL